MLMLLCDISPTKWVKYLSKVKNVCHGSAEHCTDVISHSVLLDFCSELTFHLFAPRTPYTERSVIVSLWVTSLCLCPSLLQWTETSWCWREQSWPPARCWARFSHGAQPRIHRQTLEQKNNVRYICVVYSLVYIIKVFHLNVMLLVWIDLWFTENTKLKKYCALLLRPHQLYLHSPY